MWTLNPCTKFEIAAPLLHYTGEAGLYTEIFPRGGGGNLGYGQEGGGRSLYEVLHPTLAGGGGRE